MDKNETFIILQFVLIIHPFHMVTSLPKMHFQRFPPLTYQTKLRVPVHVRVIVKLIFNFSRSINMFSSLENVVWLAPILG